MASDSNGNLVSGSPSPPVSPRLSPDRPSYHKSFALTPQWQQHGQGVSAKSFGNNNNDKDDALSLDYFAAEMEDRLVQPEMMQIAFFPMPVTAQADTTDEYLSTENANAETALGGDDFSNNSIAGSAYSYNTVNSIWDDVPQAPPDAVLGIAQAFKLCPSPNKVNVCVGAYRMCLLLLLSTA